MFKITWQDKCKQVREYHRSKFKTNSEHTINDTAKELVRAVGSVSEDLQLAYWMDKDPKVEKFKTASDALDYIKKEKLKAKIGM